MPRTPSTSVGCIPKTLRVVCRVKGELKKTVDGVERKTKVKATLFQDVETDPKNALHWGRSRVEKTPPGTEWNKREFEIIEPTVTEEKNKPLTNLRFWGIDERAEGGRAYKVIDNKGRMFDMREDIVVEAIFNDEFSNGIFTGKYIWGKCHTQMRLIRVDSVLHKELEEAGRRKAMVKIPNKELEVGAVYQMKNGDRYVYLGRIPGNGHGKGMRFAELRHGYGQEPESDLQKAYEQAIELASKGYDRIIYKDTQTMVEKIGTVNTNGHHV